jgi:hypothetical protein
MKTQTRKLARIATVVCASAAPFAARAQQAEPVAEPATESAAVAAARIAQPDEKNARPSANLPIVDSARSDAQCVTDAANARGVPVSYAAPIAVPGHTDTVADMSTETAAPVFAAAQANELEWGEPRGDAAQLAGADVPSPVRPVPLEDAARVDGARDAPLQVEGSPHRAPHADELPPARPLLLPDVQRPLRKAPVSYSAPVAVPVRAAQAHEANAGEAAFMPRDEKSATRTRHISYAAPIVVSARSGSTHMSAETRVAVQPLARVQPFALTHVKSSDTTAPVARALRLPAPAPAPQAKPPVSYAAPVAAPLRKDASVTANPPAQPVAQSHVQPVQAAASIEDPKWSMPDRVAVSDERLDRMRGGFDLASGLKVSFGISRMVVVNGNLVTTTSFNIPDISNMSAQQAQQLASINTGALLQNGPGNVVQSGALPALSGAVIQNTLNNQQIQALTTINTTVNSLSMFKNFNVGSTLSGALINAVRGQ